MPPTTTRWPSSDSSLQVPRVGVHERPDLLGDLAHRVLGEVQPEQLLLPAQPLAHRGLGRGRQRPLHGRASSAPEVEQRRLAVIRSRCVAWPAADRVVEAEQELGRVPERVRARPTLASDSSTLRLASRRSTRVQKSVSERNGAALLRAPR